MNSQAHPQWVSESQQPLPALTQPLSLSTVDLHHLHLYYPLQNSSSLQLPPQLQKFSLPPSFIKLLFFFSHLALFLPTMSSYPLGFSSPHVAVIKLESCSWETIVVFPLLVETTTQIMARFTPTMHPTTHFLLIPTHIYSCFSPQASWLTSMSTAARQAIGFATFKLPQISIHPLFRLLMAPPII